MTYIFPLWNLFNSSGRSCHLTPRVPWSPVYITLWHVSHWVLIIYLHICLSRMLWNVWRQQQCLPFLFIYGARHCAQNITWIQKRVDEWMNIGHSVVYLAYRVNTNSAFRFPKGRLCKKKKKKVSLSLYICIHIPNKRRESTESNRIYSRKVVWKEAD